MWLMLQQPEPDDYVVATGEMHSVRELCELAFGRSDLDWEAHVRVDPRTSARPRWTSCAATRPRRASGWAGRRARRSTSSSG